MNYVCVPLFQIILLCSAECCSGLKVKVSQILCVHILVCRATARESHLCIAYYARNHFSFVHVTNTKHKIDLNLVCVSLTPPTNGAHDTGAQYTYI